MPHRNHSRRTDGHRNGSEPSPAGRERRRARRVPLNAPLSVEWEHYPDVKRLRVLDISRSGFRFECSRNYAVGERGHAVCIKPEDTPLNSDFVIVWGRDVGHGRFQYGARFVKSIARRRAA